MDYNDVMELYNFYTKNIIEYDNNGKIKLKNGYKNINIIPLILKIGVCIILQI